MTEHEQDAAMRRVLLDSVERRMRLVDLESLPPLPPSSRHQAQMRAMLKNPLKWAAGRERPRWKTALLRAAMFFLALVAGFGVLMLSVPTARAAFLRWVITWQDETHWTYHFTGHDTPDEMPDYGITALPEGFVETERLKSPVTVNITYENELGEAIYLDYVYMFSGALPFYNAGDSDVYDIEVNGMYGQYTESRIPGNYNGAVWTDEEASIHFNLTTVLDRHTILRMAESVSLVKTPK